MAQQAAQSNWSYETYLAYLVDEEANRRSGNRRTRRIKEAKFPPLKELADFDYKAIPQLNKQRVLALAEGTYLERAEPVIFVGNPGLGKTHLAIGLALLACRQDHRVRFYTVTQLVNELAYAQQEHQLPMGYSTGLPFGVTSWNLWVNLIDFDSRCLGKTKGGDANINDLVTLFLMIYLFY